MAKKKDKVVSISPKANVFPEGDPRNNMTWEEISKIAAEEDAQIERDLRVVAAAQQAKATRKELYEGDIEVEDEDEEEEEFELDLKNGVAKQVVGEGVVILNGQNVSELVDTIKPYEDTYGDIIRGSLIQFALRIVRDDLTKGIDELEAFRFKSNLKLPSSVDHELSAGENKLWQMRNEVRSISYRSDLTKEDIPEWAQEDVKRYIEGAMRQLLSLVDKNEL